MRKKIGLMVIIALAALPVIRWFLIDPLSYRFFNFPGTMTSLGQITGILGFALFSINLILSARLGILERFFNGLDKVYSYHRQLGSISFSLILFHPLLLAVSYLFVSARAAAEFLTPFKDIPVTYGIVSLLLMILLMILTIYIKLKYQTWKLSHKFMVLVFVFAIMHSVLISSDISRDIFLRSYLIALAGIGLAAGTYQAFVSMFLNRHARYILKTINILNPQVVELELEPKNKAIQFIPGQFIFIRFLKGNISSESHPFSISSASDGSSLKVVIKSLGDFTAQLKNLQPGLEVSVEGPYGKFSHLNIQNKNQVWIAGGVGITPFVSMARSLKGSDYDIDLYYCVNRLEEAVLLAELKELESAKKIRLKPWCSIENGRLDAQKILELSPGLRDSDILICGPAPFMLSLQKQLRALNIKKARIHFENFKFI